MNAFIVLAAVVAASANAGVLLSSGSSVSQRSEDGLGNYAFSYDEKHSTGGSFRQETGSHGVKVGSYGLNVADGRQRVVKYVADGAGFRASISTNEQGTAPSLPAAAAYNVAAAPVAVAAAPVASYAAPVAVAAPVASYAAPVAVAAPAAYAAPVAVAKATTYSSAVNHGAVHVAPVASYAAAPVASYAAAPVASYAAAPVASYAAAPVAVPVAKAAAPAVFAANVYAPAGALVL